MAYCDYQYYSVTYMGSKLSAADFAVMAERASDYIDYITANRVPADVPEAVKKACCAISEEMFSAEKANADFGPGVMASQTVGSWSATFRSPSELTEAQTIKLKQIAERYLVHTGLLYRGMSYVHSAYCNHI